MGATTALGQPARSPAYAACRPRSLRCLLACKEVSSIRASATSGEWRGGNALYGPSAALVTSSRQHSQWSGWPDYGLSGSGGAKPCQFSPMVPEGNCPPHPPHRARSSAGHHLACGGWLRRKPRSLSNLGGTSSLWRETGENAFPPSPSTPPTSPLRSCGANGPYANGR